MKQGLSRRIQDTLEKYPDNVLIEDQSVHWTGLEIRQKIDELQNYFEVSTLENSLVGICFPNFAYQGLAIIAVLRAKRVPVILSYTDLMQQPSQWMDRLSVDLFISTKDFNSLVEDRVQTLSLGTEGEITFGKQKETQGRSLQGVRAPRGTGIVLYTSGSTGEAKGICVPEDGINLTSDYLIDYFGLSEKTVTPIVLPVCHSMALNTQFLPTFFAGGRSSFFNSRLGMNKLYRHICAIEGTFISLIGEVLRICWEEMKQKNLPPNTLVQHVQLAGGMISEKHLLMASELFPNALVHKGYGLTEGIRVTMVDQRDPAFLTKIVGRPLPFIKVEVRGSEGEILPTDAMGEIFVKGPSVMMGILGRNTHPTDERGFLATGDVGSLNEAGQLSVMGRMDSVFKVNGLKVSGFEIEKIALTVSRFVREAKCISVDDSRTGRTKVALFLEIPQDLQNEFFNNSFEVFYSSLWKEFKALSYFPRDIVLVTKLPKTSNGKISLRGLRALWENENKSRMAIEVPGNLVFCTVPVTEEIINVSLDELLKSATL